LNTTDQERWLYDLIDATARTNKRQRTASSEELNNWLQRATPDTQDHGEHNTKNSDFEVSCGDKDNMLEGMLSGWSEQLNFKSWGSAEESQESAVPDPDEWHNRLYKMGQSDLSKHPHWEIVPDFRPIQSLCAI
jgi:hypothetical protein